MTSSYLNLGLVALMTLCVTSCSAECSATTVMSRLLRMTITVQCQSPTNATSIEESLRSANITVRNVYTLVLARNSLTDLTSGIFDYTPNLQVLDLSANMFSAVPSGSFSIKLSSLHDLVISNNLITGLDADAFPFLHNLQTLALTKNHIKNITISAFRGLNRLQELRLEHNLIENLPRGLWEEMPKLDKLYLDFNVLTRISPALIASGSLTRLSVIQNRIQSLPENAFTTVNRLVHLDLSENVIGDVSGSAFRGLHKLVSLILTSNRIHRLPEGIFDELINLSTLLMGKNYITALTPSLFRHLSRLTSLDLSANPITRLYGWHIQPLVSLEKLTMKKTYITRLPDLTGLNNLKRLELDGSLITKVYGCDLERLPSLTWLSLTDCPLLCDCDLRWLRRWYQSSGETGLQSVVRHQTVCSPVSPQTLRGDRFLDLNILALCPAGETLGNFCDVASTTTSSSSTSTSTPSPAAISTTPPIVKTTSTSTSTSTTRPKTTSTAPTTSTTTTTTTTAPPTTTTRPPTTSTKSPYVVKSSPPIWTTIPHSRVATTPKERRWRFLDTLYVSSTHITSLTVKWLSPRPDEIDASTTKRYVHLQYHRVHEEDFVSLKVDAFSGEVTVSNLYTVSTYNICLSEDPSHAVKPGLDSGCIFGSTNRSEFVAMCVLLVLGLVGISISAVLFLLYVRKRRAASKSLQPVTYFTNPASTDGSVANGFGNSNLAAEGVITLGVDSNMSIANKC